MISKFDKRQAIYIEQWIRLKCLFHNLSNSSGDLPLGSVRALAIKLDERLALYGDGARCNTASFVEILRILWALDKNVSIQLVCEFFVELCHYQCFVASLQNERIACCSFTDRFAHGLAGSPRRVTLTSFQIIGQIFRLLLKISVERSNWWVFKTNFFGCPSTGGPH